MPPTNRDLVGQAMEHLKNGLNPFVEREMRAAAGDGWFAKAQAVFAERNRSPLHERDRGQLDAQALLQIMLDNWGQPPDWNGVFGRKLGKADRNLVHTLIDERNAWAHQRAYSADAAIRALDRVEQLLTAVGAADEAAAVQADRLALMRQRVAAEAPAAEAAGAPLPIAGRPSTGLRPWREVMTPHPDVAAGRFKQTEFAANLAQVARREGSSEYYDPTEFFRRTYLTHGLRALLTGALQRLGGTGGQPVVELHTSFGGGKTHSMIALYHLASGATAADLPGIEPLLKDAGLAAPVAARRAVLVGQALDPSKPRRKPDGIEVRTLWGELAWQIGAAAGDAAGAYSLVAEADRRGVNPGSDTLRELFDYYAPCLVLVDEWAAYARNLWGVDGLPAGSYEANFSFVQSLTEAAGQADRALVVATVPISDDEVGGTVGKDTVQRFSNLLGRVESAWRPATAEEGFEIVRRRLFQPIPPDRTADRDAVVRAFADLYRAQAADFPNGCGEGAYERRLRNAYPIHPELFDRLYGDWARLDGFQQTRGVLRLMATIIHRLWENGDPSLMILPASVPLDDLAVQSEQSRYLPNNWVPVINADVDGPLSLPLKLDRANPSFGRYSACRRVARTLYIGSAPTLTAAQHGLDDRHVKLGCVQPGEAVATFGDALRYLSDRATHLYDDGGRYWFSTQPSVNRTAEERAARQRREDVYEEIRARLRHERDDRTKPRGAFAKIHFCPAAAGDVPDEREARLVVLDPEYPHAAGGESQAVEAAGAILASRGPAPRTYRNALVFLAADRARLGELEQAVRQYLAWKSIDDDREALDLNPSQLAQARSRRAEADKLVAQRLPETYRWLLVPLQEPTGPLEWEKVELKSAAESLAARASSRLVNDGALVEDYAATQLRQQLDRIPLWRGADVPVRQLWDDFAQYPYLPRLRDAQVLCAAVQQGCGKLTWEAETFAYAEGRDDATGRYHALRAGELVGVRLETGLVVKPEAARRQLDADAAARAPASPGAEPIIYAPNPTGNAQPVKNGSASYATDGATAPATGPTYTRYQGSVDLTPLRMGTEAARIAEEVIQHLLGVPGAKVAVTLEIAADLPQGVPDSVVRTVRENGRVLRFRLDSDFHER